MTKPGLRPPPPGARRGPRHLSSASLFSAYTASQPDALLRRTPGSPGQPPIRAQDQNGTSRVSPPITCCRPCEERLVSPRQSHHRRVPPPRRSHRGRPRYRYLYRHSPPHPLPSRHLSAHTRPSRETHPGHSPPPPVAQSSHKTTTSPTSPKPARHKTQKKSSKLSTSPPGQTKQTSACQPNTNGLPYYQTAETNQRRAPFSRLRRIRVFHRRERKSFPRARRPARSDETRHGAPLGT